MYAVASVSSLRVAIPPSKRVASAPRAARTAPGAVAASLRAPGAQIALHTPLRNAFAPLKLRAQTRRTAPARSAPTTVAGKLIPQPVANLCGTLTNLFPLWVAVGGAIAVLRPEYIAWFKAAYVNKVLSLTMLCMGLTIPMGDFKDALQTPKSVLAGVFLQYTVMPALGYFIGTALNLASPLRVGLVLVACCPGGTASNLVTFLARANTALSVVLTTISTGLAVFLTPFLTKYLVGSEVPVNASALLMSTMEVVALPVLLGVLLNKFFPYAVSEVKDLCPFFAVISVALICSSVIGANASTIMSMSPTLIGAVLLLHSGGFAFGFLLSKLLGLNTRAARTISIEVGMQNSALGAVLATQHFANPLTAVPCAISASCHSCLGSLLAAIWRLQDASFESKDTETVIYRF